MSRRTEAKKARRNKRRAGQGNWLPDTVLSELVATEAAIATDLEAFDQRITERGWEFDDEESDEEFAFWFYEPSGADVDDDELAPVTTIWMSADEDAAVVHLLFVGSSDEYEFAPEELFEHLEVIEAYRLAEPVPQFGA